MKQYPNLAARVFNTPLMVDPRKFDVILGVIGPRLGVEVPAGVEITAALAEQKPRYEGDMTADGVAVLDISGTLVNRSSWMDAASGMCSYDSIIEDVERAAADARVSGILLRIDSYGGEVSGAFDAVAAIRKAAAVKPVWAAVNDAAFSAGYLLASQASKVFVSVTGGVGSVGVIAYHVDCSAMEARAGLKYTAIFAGAHKADLSPHEPLSDEARANLQGEIDRCYSLFVETVASARKSMGVKAVRDTEARCYFGADAIQVGLADQIGTYREALAALTAEVQPTKVLGASSLRKTAQADAGISPDSELNKENPSMDEKELATGTAAAPTQVVDPAVTAKAKADGEAAATARVAQINALCKIAKRPDLLGGFLEKNMSVEQVQDALMNAQAAETDADPIQSMVAEATRSNGNALGKLDAAAQSLAAQRGTTKEQAYEQVLRANPALYAEHKQHMRATALRSQLMGR